MTHFFKRTKTRPHSPQPFWRKGYKFHGEYAGNIVVEDNSARIHSPENVKEIPTPCTCTAYNFPHRLGGGRCFGPCPYCGAGSREEKIAGYHTDTIYYLECENCGHQEW